MKPNRNDDLMARTIKTFSDILILKYLKTNPLSSGYEILVGFMKKSKLILAQEQSTMRSICLKEKKQ